MRTLTRRPAKPHMRPRRSCLDPRWPWEQVHGHNLEPLARRPAHRIRPGNARPYDRAYWGYQ